MHRSLLVRVIPLVAFAALVGARSSGAAVDYEKQIKPLLAAKCYRCHGPLKQESGLRLDTAALAAKGGDRGPAFIAGKSAESYLVAALLGKDDIERMPAEGKPLSDEEIALIQTWIDEGAVAPADEKPADPLDHWSFRPVARPTLPSTSRDLWSRGAIDRFIAAKYDERGLRPQAKADRTTLLRRVCLDLIGLPPTADELAEFLADASPDAYERAVDRLLASPQHGERWARHWMDVWRYSDWAGWTDGGQIRDSQPHIWRWRDWIVESLNADRPYDRMIVEMLAADEVAPTDESALRATGFLARNYKMLSRETWMQDVVEHTSKGFLALTMNCSQCHDHMYDPVLHEDYFRLRAIFEPHQVRIDRVRGQLDTKLDGLPRAYDAALDAKTKYYIRGDERTPDENRPIEPGVPTVFGRAGFEIAAVELPLTASYPDLRESVRADMLRGLLGQLAAARKQLGESLSAANANAETLRKLTAESDASDVAEAAAAAAKTHAAVVADSRAVVAAQAAVDSINARFAADLAKHRGAAAEEVVELAQSASRAESFAALAAADSDRLRAEQTLASLVGTTHPDEKRLAAETEKKLAEARERSWTALQATLTYDEKYTPIGTSYPRQSTGRRTALARWIARKENPLTARVAVNHLWLRHFGQAIVPTVFDFGKNGRPPVNGPLLDWLAAELGGEGRGARGAGLGEGSAASTAWTMKSLHRRIVASSVYRQAATFDGENARVDPDNVALWRWPARRIEAETVRDMVLYVSASLDLAHGGPDIDHHAGQKIPRRSIYFRHAPEKQMDFLQLFDAAAPTQCYRRTESVMPQQALALANSRLTLAASRRLARELSRQLSRVELAADANQAVSTNAPQSPVPSSQPRFIAAAFRHVLAREATPEEMQTCAEFLDAQTRLFAENRARLTAVAQTAGDLEKPSGEPELRARENLVHALLNHHDFVTQR
ncbi:MAG: multidrug transporter [Planctomycetota bacterium]|nr:MAG: multidrug transporter [Planctomycetota bacterium]